MQEIIAYRNPLEAALWHSLDTPQGAGIILGGVAAVVIVILISSVLDWLMTRYTRDSLGAWTRRREQPHTQRTIRWLYYYKGQLAVTCGLLTWVGVASWFWI
jgi:hypothetical protein